MPIVSKTDFIATTFDYVIVGGGCAGLALAARLSEDPDVTVGVLEAGSYTPAGEDERVDAPGRIGSLIMDAKYDWMHLTVPQKYANERRIPSPRGKGLGGSTLINFLGTNRPSKEELDAIERLGSDGWNWESLLHYCMKSETVTTGDVPSDTALKFSYKPDPALHGTAGPVKKSFPSTFAPIHSQFLDTAEALGVPKLSEPDSGKNIGAFSMLSTIDHIDAIRSSSSTAYFEPNASRENFLVLPNAWASRVMLEEGTDHQQHAVGVEFFDDGALPSVVGVRRDVILCAGTFHTPQILELSGIGNSETLRQHEVRCVVNLPGVGENLQDHVRVTTIAQIDDTYENINLSGETLRRAQTLYARKEGPLVTVPAIAFVCPNAHTIGTSEDIKAWNDSATIGSSSVHGPPELIRGLEKQYEIQRSWIAGQTVAHAEIVEFLGPQRHPGYAPDPRLKYNSLIVALMHPLSRGSVHISSSDALTPPDIDPSYFSNTADLDALVRAVQFALKMYSIEPFRDIFKAHALPPADILEGGSVEDQTCRLRAWVKANSGTLYHPVGTASMLPRDDGGVVDAELRVYGTDNLRVVDASIIPMALACHIQEIVYAIAEKAADILKMKL